ncbi:hypothetical protein RCG23_21250 [Neobacillus sp. PS3-34]|uniref:hypothetical protein n=1 Tax=Neobacillus sp. PS3-34 TaxID=3070678 RepID=UPI0027E20D4D|nr:hypothetical protein [Neobacillus sp. PS3-34]WML47828.1 hypothetical protein RCG23_21250 [Neobacillus sp. PS3-34]
MYKKVCNHCHQPSFSSCDSGTWICPVCSTDITHVFHQDAESRMDTKKKLELLANRYTQKPVTASAVNKYI